MASAHGASHRRPPAASGPGTGAGRRRDRDRQATYDAEAAAFEGSAFEEQIGLYDAARLAGAVAQTTWWRTHVRREPPALRDARPDARRSTARRSRWEIRFAPGHASVITLAHELAHLAAPGDGGHDDRFRRTHLDLLHLLAGPSVARRLHEAFTGVGLGIAPAAVPGPDDLGPDGLLGRFGDVLRTVDDDARRHAARIRKLLAKAASTTAAEADALTAKALDLSVRHGIDQAMLDAAGHTDDIVERKVLLASGPYVGARWHLLALVADHLACEAFYRAGPLGRVVTVVGYARDADQTLDLFGALDHQAALGALAVSGRRSTVTARREFLYGFASGVGSQLDEATARAGLDDPTHPAAVVLVERRSAVGDHVARTYHLRSERRSRVQASGAYRAGTEAGNRAALRRPPLRTANRALPERTT